ncbi:sensor histidine kinase [Epibacterium sp. Ofav1-8]|uniref:sensor histidine kinase n=1 Tax=Epibacterium sp. Ofav1-8 TaxID=2917735 RepID=UPI001EF61A55|nr:ATP-binding protein [Epibacterium sp. Ofav1-8]MCG7625359.1 ATP-binding protein [Epibacterium sp. Ofav1-8]
MAGVSLKWISIKTKVALGVCFILGVSFAVFFSLSYRDTSQRIRQHTEQLIAQNHQTHSRYILDTLTTMSQDAETIVGFPPIAGIFRSLMTPSGIDPYDGSSLTHWRKRLETLFVSLIQNRDAYSQIRLLLPQRNWREFVRVDSINGSVRITSQDELQAKGDEPYVRTLVSGSSEESQFSHVTRNREHGVASGPPTLRSLKRIADIDGNLIGAIVINAHIAELFALPKTGNEIGQTYYAIENKTSAGTLLGPEDMRFAVQAESGESLEAVDDIFTTGEGQLVAGDSNTGIFVTRVDLSSHNIPFTIRIASFVDLRQMLAAARTALLHNVLNALGLTLSASCMGYFLTSRLLAPLEKLLTDIRSSSSSLRPVPEEFDGHDEVSVIAKEFSHLTNDLIRETQRLEMVLSNAAEGVVTLREDGSIEDVNPAATQILGLAAPRLIGRRLADVLHCDPKLTRSNLMHRADSDEPLRFSVTCRHGASENTILQIAVQRALYAEGTRFIVMLRDITTETFAAQKADALIAALKRSNAELDQFAYIASHDLKAPLRVINNAISWLEEDLEPYLNDDTRESMHLLQSRANRMERLLNDLLQHSRIGRVAEPETQISGRELADELLGLLEVPDGMTVRFAESFLKLRFRKLPLETVLVNLLSNSIRHHDRPHGEIEVSVEEEAGFLRFRVEDDGPGIEPIYHDRIFEVFQTLQSRDQLEGSGMGLAFVKKHIEVAGGEIQVISDGIRGTVFEFRWPRDLRQQNEAA